MGWLVRTGAVLFFPRALFRRIMTGEGSGLVDVMLLMFPVMLGIAPVSAARVAAGAGSQPGVLLSRLVSMYIGFAATPLLACVAVALLLAGLLRLRGERAPLERLVTAAVYLWVPVAVLGLLGSALALLGAPTWILPNIPISVALRIDLPWWIIAIRIPVSYGWSAWLAWLLYREASGEQTETPPAPSRTGAFALGAWILAAWTVGGFYVSAHFDQIRPPMAGDKAEAFDLPRADGGGRLSLSSLSGKPVVIEFWGTWCPVCVKSMPGLLAWAKAHPDVKLLLIHQGGTPSEVADFAKQRGYKTGIFLVDDQGEASGAYRVDTVPSCFVVGPDGVLTGVHVGAPSPAWLDKHLVTGRDSG